MRTYIMLSCTATIGGAENYINSKVEFLQNNNWKVVVFSFKPYKSQKEEEIPWENLKRFACNQRAEFDYFPAFCPAKIVNQMMDWMKTAVGESDGEIIIESTEAVLAVWGEMLAKELSAKHFCFLLSERPDLYGAKQFLYFKYLRGELAGIHKTSIPSLFQNYIKIEEKNSPVLRAAHYDSVQDVENLKINNLIRMDWNISYIGRNKQYVRNIIKGVQKFASVHSDKQIQFVVLGDIEIGDNITSPENLHVVHLGFMRPIPKAFFDCVDVVIAGAGCASIAWMAGVLTIVADAATCMASGLLGYTTDSSLFGNGRQESFDEALENTLVKKIWRDMPYKPCQNMSNEEVEQCYEDHFKFVEESNQAKKYFDFQKYPQKYCSKIRNLKAFISCYMRLYTPSLFFITQKVLKDVRRKFNKWERK